MASKKGGKVKFVFKIYYIGFILIAILLAFLLIRGIKKYNIQQEIAAENLERANTPKVAIQMLTDLSTTISGNQIELKYVVSNAYKVFFNDEIVFPSGGIYSQTISLYNMVTTVNIKGENKYWNDEQIFAITREKTEQEIQEEKLAEENRIAEEKQAEKEKIQADKKKIGVSENKISSFFVDTMSLIKGEAGTAGQLLPVFDDECGNGTSIGYGNSDIMVLITIDTYGDTNNLNCASIVADANPEGLLYMLSFAGLIDKDVVNKGDGGFLANMASETKRKGKSIRYLNSRKYVMSEEYEGVFQLKISSAK